MRSVSARVRRGGALLLLLVAFAVPPVCAAEGGFPYEPPEARGRPPIGGDTTETAEARARPPIGVSSTSGEPGFFELLADWIVFMARVRPPIG